MTCNGTNLDTFDCTKAGLTCAANATFGEAACRAPGCSLEDARDCKESCSDDGKTAIICVGGVHYPIDCTSYADAGITKCHGKFTSKYASGVRCE